MRLLAAACALFACPVWAATPADAGTEAAGLPITLREVAREALEASAELRLANESVRTWRFAVDAESGPFVPVFRLSADVKQAADPAITPFYDYFDQRDSILSTSAVGAAALAGKFTLGTEYELKVGWETRFTDERGAALTPSHRLPAELSLSQPLLRNFGDANRKDLRSALLRRDQAELDFDRAKVDVLLKVATSYVGLQAAQARLESRRQARELAKSLAAVTDELVLNGRLPATAKLPQSVAVSVAEQDVLGAQVALGNAQSLLAQALDREGEQPFRATEALAPVVEVVDPSHAGRLAEAKYPAVRVKGEEVELARVEHAFRQNQALPDLRLRAAVGTYGLAGTSQCQAGYFVDGVTPCSVPARVVGAPGDAAARFLDAKYGYYTAGLLFSIPLSHHAMRAAADAAKIARVSRELELAHLKTTVRLQAANSARAVASFLAELEEARRSVALAQKSLDAARQSYLLGKNTVFDLLKAQELLAETRDREVSSAERLAVENLRLLALTGKLGPALLGGKP